MLYVYTTKKIEQCHNLLLVLSGGLALTYARCAATDLSSFFVRINAVMPCCRCNRSGFCKRCVCVKEGRPCAGCLPRRLGHCQNSATVYTGPQPAHEPVVPSLCGQSSTILSTNPAATNNSHVASPWMIL